MNIVDIGSVGGIPKGLKRVANKCISFDPLGQEKSEGNKVVHKYCIFDKNEKRPFYILNKNQCSSLLKPNSKWINQNFGQHSHVGWKYRLQKVVKVQCKRLDWFLPVDHEYDFLKIDAQGAELRILQGAGECLKSFSFIEVESYLVPFYCGGAMFREVNTFLKKFKFHAIMTLRPENPLMNDWFFVREGANMESLSTFYTSKLPQTRKG